MAFLNDLVVKGTTRFIGDVYGSLIGNATNADIAEVAYRDELNQSISNTYIKALSVSGKTVTYTRGDGSTGTITTQDMDTKVTQNVTTSNAAFPLLLAPNGQTATTTTHSYFDSGVTLNPSTNTITANITGTAANANMLNNITDGYWLGTFSAAGSGHGASHRLQCQHNKFSDGRFGLKIESGYEVRCDYATNSTYADSALTASSSQCADYLTTARTISLTGVISGSGSFDGSDNLTINTTLINNPWGVHVPHTYDADTRKNTNGARFCFYENAGSDYASTYELPYKYVFTQSMINSSGRGVELAYGWPRGGRVIWIRFCHDGWSEWEDLTKYVSGYTVGTVTVSATGLNTQNLGYTPKVVFIGLRNTSTVFCAVPVENGFNFSPTTTGTYDYVAFKPYS